MLLESEAQCPIHSKVKAATFSFCAPPAWYPASLEEASPVWDSHRNTMGIGQTVLLWQEPGQQQVGSAVSRGGSTKSTGLRCLSNTSATGSAAPYVYDRPLLGTSHVPGTREVRRDRWLGPVLPSRHSQSSLFFIFFLTKAHLTQASEASVGEGVLQWRRVHLEPWVSWNMTVSLSLSTFHMPGPSKSYFSSL